MILEVAILNIKEGKTAAFEEDFQKARPYIQNNPDYLSQELKRCMENDHRYILLVKWESLEDHEEGFRKSENYGPWKRLLHHYYDPFPVVEHYEAL